MGRLLCTGIILISSFYAWLMTATGIQLTQYRPAFSGVVGAAQPYVLAGLVHVAITYYYLRLSSPSSMTRRGMISLAVATPFVILFVGWTVLMSSYSIMFERRSETAQIESSNKLQSIADEFRSLDSQMAANYASTLANLGQRLENEINRPEPGVKQGCGRRCREIRAAQNELQNFQHLRTPVLESLTIGIDLARALGTLEREHQQISARLSDFEGALIKFSGLNAVLAERVVTVDDVSSRQSGQFRIQLERLNAKLVDLRENERNLTDLKFRGLNELVNDISQALSSGQVARMLDLFTVILIAVAPDFLSLIMALLSWSLARKGDGEATVMAAIGPQGHWWQRIRQVGGATDEKRQVKAMVKAHLTERNKGHQPETTMPQLKPPAETTAPLESPSAAGTKVLESVHDQLNKMDLELPSRRRRPSDEA
ncbi:conserved membrane hypothetical protein [uncultured Gammaproteobacteria bacterium]